MNTAFGSLKAGDRVWVGKNRSDRGSIRTVFKTTQTQIVLDWNGNGSYLPRYRMDGYRIGGGMFSEHISGVATKEKCAILGCTEERRGCRNRAKGTRRSGTGTQAAEIIRGVRQHRRIGENGGLGLRIRAPRKIAD